MKQIRSRYRYSYILLKQLVKTDFKLRYQGSVLGYAWSLLRPLLLFVILYFVFVRMLKFGNKIEHFPVYLLLGIVIWNFFQEMTTRSLTSIVERGDLLRKIRIPRWVIILSSSISAVINLLLNMVVVVLLMMLNHVDMLNTIWLLPLILLEVYFFALGLSLFLSAAYVKFRDISYIWEVVLQAAFYLTPIIYPLSLITNINFQKIMLLSPIAQAIQDARYAAVSHSTIIGYHLFTNNLVALIPFLIVVITFLAGLKYFKAHAKYFAEEI